MGQPTDGAPPGASSNVIDLAAARAKRDRERWQRVAEGVEGEVVIDRQAAHALGAMVGLGFLAWMIGRALSSRPSPPP